MMTLSRILSAVLIVSVAHADDHSSDQQQQQQEQVAPEQQQQQQQQNPVQQRPVIQDLTDITCTNVPHSFWTRLPGLGRWAKKERSEDQKSHTGFPLQELTVKGSGRNDAITATFGNDDHNRTQTQKLSGDFRVLSEVETSKLKWPKRWWNKLRHVEKKTVYSGEWLDSADNTNKFKHPWTLKLVRTIKTKKKQNVVQIIGVADIQDENGNEAKFDVTCEGTLPQ